MENIYVNRRAFLFDNAWRITKVNEDERTFVIRPMDETSKHWMIVPFEMESVIEWDPTKIMLSEVDMELLKQFRKDDQGNYVIPNDVFGL